MLSITTGEFRPGDALPSEAEINAAFKVSRTTARASLERLRQEGLILRQSGRGSIVLKPKVEQPVNQLASFSEDMRRRGLKASYATFGAGPAALPAEAAAALGLEQRRQRVLHSPAASRQRRADGHVGILACAVCSRRQRGADAG